MRQSSVDSKPTGADLKQRHLFLLLYITSAAFLAAFVLTTRLHTRWHQPAHVLTLAIGAFAVWSLYRLLILTDAGRGGLCGHQRNQGSRLFLSLCRSPG
jgi:hypothetical protein